MQSWCRQKLMLRNFTPVLLLALALGAAGCRARRPEIIDAKAEFLRRYPTAEILDVRVSEDEVVARSFRVTYRLRHEATKILELQYMKSENGVYVLRPDPPSELP